MGCRETLTHEEKHSHSTEKHFETLDELFFETLDDLLLMEADDPDVTLTDEIKAYRKQFKQVQTVTLTVPLHIDKYVDRLDHPIWKRRLGCLCEVGLQLKTVPMTKNI